MVRLIICGVLSVYLVVLVVWALLSWFPLSHDSAARKLMTVLDAVIQPVLTPLRRVIPQVDMGGRGIDISFIVLIIVLFLVNGFVCGGV